MKRNWIFHNFLVLLLATIFFSVAVRFNLSISVAQRFPKCFFDVYLETFFQNIHTRSLSFHDNSTVTHPLIQWIRKSRDQYALVC